jgi:recombination protein RecA
MVLLAGQEASFKSSFACICAANSQKANYKVVVIDTEGAMSDNFVQRWGLNSEEILYIYEPIVDNISAIFGQILESEDEKFVILLDSIGGLESKKLLADAADGTVKADQGGLSRKIKQCVKLFTAIVKKKKSIGIFTAHTYGNPNAGMFASGEEIGGGKACKYLSDIIIMLKKSKKLDKEKNVIGNVVKAQTLKNRFYPAFNKCEVDIDYINGINKYHGMLELAIEFGFIEQKGAGWMTNLITGEKVQGAINTDPWFTEEMLNKINEIIKTRGYSTVDEELKQQYIDEETGEVKY